MKRQILCFSVLTFVLLASMPTEASLEKARTHFQKGNDISKYEKAAYELMMSKYYFTALPFALEYLQQGGKSSKNFEKALRILAFKTGTESFMNLPVSVLRNAQSPTLNIILGFKQFEARNYQGAIDALAQIEDASPFESEAYMVRAGSLALMRKNDAAYNDYKHCYNTAYNEEKDAKNEKVKRYYAYIKESCLIHVARLKFSSKKYDDALASYDEVSKRSYRWPYILLEKAWISFKQTDYNRALGILVTYKYPLLKSYFIPESEVLRAMSYLRLCLWDDAQQVVEQFYQVYKPHSDNLKRLLLSQRQSDTYFLQLAQEKLAVTEQIHPFIRNLVTQIRKTIKYNLDFSSIQTAEEELKNLMSLKQTPWTQQLISQTKTIINNRERALNWFIKKRMFDFINEIHQLSYEMFKIRIEIMSKKRTLLYKNNQLASDRSRGSYQNVKRSVDQYFWEFHGAFWADELGEYSFGLKSNCLNEQNAGGQQ